MYFKNGKCISSIENPEASERGAEWNLYQSYKIDSFNNFSVYIIKMICVLNIKIDEHIANNEQKILKRKHTKKQPCLW